MSDDLAAEFDRLREPLESMCDQLQGWLRRTAGMLGVKEFSVSGRVKETDSLMRKVLKRPPGHYDDPLRDMVDKVGVRIDVLHEADADRLCRAIEAEGEAFTLVREPDHKITKLGAATLGYLGVHFDVRPATPPEGLPREYALAEIQVRTFAQAMWAMASHDLIYKLRDVLAIPTAVERRIHRLMALVELFDDQVAHVRGTILTHPDYPAARVIDTLESRIVRFTSPSRDTELTKIVVDTVLEGMDEEELERLPELLEQWAIENEDKLGEIYVAYSGDARHPLLRQPEALLVFHQLGRGLSFKTELRQVWERRLPLTYLEGLANVWGEPY